MRLFTPAIATLGSLASIPVVSAWGAAGHEIVATIAQMYLHPSVLPTLCDILDFPQQSCHIATVATWADKHRMQMRWSAALHYVGALDDYPSQTCAFPGPRGWAGSKNINVLDGIKNTTGLLEDWVNNDVSNEVAEESLKFLIHFIGDMHQPLHLTGRDRGGNSVKVRFGTRQTNLHSLWDGYLIAKAVRVVPRNYSRPLPYPQVENALRGTIYDAFIRRILWEGILNPWSEKIDSWLDCPAPTSASASLLSGLPSSGLLGIFRNVYQFASKAFEGFVRDGVEINPDGPVVCPYAWAQPIHKLNCELIWPREIDQAPYNEVSFDHDNGHIHNHAEEDFIEEVDEHSFDESVNRLIDLDTPEYAGRVYGEMIIERLLAQGGIRLAGVLNYLFADYGPEFDAQRGAFLSGLKD